MARDEAKVRVRLDTSQAKAELRDVTTQAEHTAAKASGGIRHALGAGFRLIGAGAALGTGIQAVKGATDSGVADIVGETFAPIGAMLNDFFLGTIDDEARARHRAREETISVFGAAAGHMKAMPPGAQSWFESVAALRQKEEEGASLIRSHLPMENLVGKMIDRIIEKLAEAISSGVKEIVDSIGKVFGR